MRFAPMILGPTPCPECGHVKDDKALVVADAIRSAIECLQAGRPTVGAIATLEMAINVMRDEEVQP